MVVVQQILPPEAQFQTLCGSPCQVRVDSRNGCNLLGRRSTDEVRGSIPSQTMRQLHVGPQLSLMLWVPKFRQGNNVSTRWFQMQIGLQKRVARTQSPTTRQFHVGGNFSAGRRAIQFILESGSELELDWTQKPAAPAPTKRGSCIDCKTAPNQWRSVHWAATGILPHRPECVRA
jgi:hypothetical protein